VPASIPSAPPAPPAAVARGRGDLNIQVLAEPPDNLEDWVYEQLCDALSSGRYEPGQTFTIRSLAEVYGTSPMPVRDALKRLAAEKALDVLPNRSVRVPLMSRARFQEILQVRLSLEPMVAAKATELISGEDVERMAEDDRAMREAQAAGDTREYLARNQHFHYRLYRAADTIVIMSVIQSMWMQIGPYLHQIFTASRGLQASAEHHIELLRALRRRDAAAVSKAIWNDLADAADVVIASNRFVESDKPRKEKP
jgi:DNA-binding GntR family transcriptional regulator